VPPIMVKSDANPDGTPIEAFDEIRAGVLKDRSQFWKDLAYPFFGANRDGSAVSEGARDDFWRQGMLVGLKGAYDCIKAFSETDFTEDLKALDVPIFIAHGDDDQIVPIKDAALKAIDLVKHGTLKVYPGAPHGIYGAYQEELDKDILAFLAS
jgi:non-heme chloroperoxidase